MSSLFPVLAAATHWAFSAFHAPNRRIFIDNCTCSYRKKIWMLIDFQDNGIIQPREDKLRIKLLHPLWGGEQLSSTWMIIVP